MAMVYGSKLNDYRNLGHSPRHCFLKAIFLKAGLEATTSPALERMDEGKATR